MRHAEISVDGYSIVVQIPAIRTAVVRGDGKADNPFAEGVVRNLAPLPVEHSQFGACGGVVVAAGRGRYIEQIDVTVGGLCLYGAEILFWLSLFGSYILLTASDLIPSLPIENISRIMPLLVALQNIVPSVLAAVSEL